MSTGKSASAEKPPRIKGLVKRCRSFKEDLISRLARNRSVGKDEAAAFHARGGSGGRKGHSCHSEGTSPVPPGSNNSSTRRTDTPDCSNSHFIISNRLKEAYLTLSFVENLVQKKCIDLLGGSSNVMLDLMCHLINELKKTPFNESEPYKSAISMVKTALTEFLTSVDVLLLLRDKYDQSQQNIYYEKLSETLNHARESITKLKSLIEAKENGYHGGGSSNCGYSGSTPTLLTSTPTSSVSGTTVHAAATNKLPHSPGSRSTGEDSNTQSLDTGFCSEDKRPPLPPKLKQWTAKSFDNYLSSSPPSSSPIHHHQRYNDYNYDRQSRHRIDFPFNPAEHSYSTSLLSQWLEETSLNAGYRDRRQSISSTHQLSASKNQPSQKSISSTENCDFKDWTDSALYVASTRSRTNSIITSSKVQATISGPNTLGVRQTYDACSQYSEPSCSGSHSHLHLTNKKIRTYSDSFYGVSNNSESDSDDPDPDMTENNPLIHETKSHHTGGTRSRCSQSLSTGSSLDNLLLIDSNSARSAGMSPNSQRISVSSNTTNTQSPLLLAGANNSNNYDPELEGDVFLNENGSAERLVVVDQEDEPPPELPKKIKPGSFLMNSSARTFLIGGHVYSDKSKRLNGNVGVGGRCPSPYDNVDSETLESLDPTTNQPISHAPHYGNNNSNSQVISYSESRYTLVGAAGAIGNSGSSSDTPYEEKPPLPPKKKHSITAYVELMHNFDGQNHQYVPHPHFFQHHQHFHNHRGNFTAIQSTGQSCSSHGSSSGGGGCQSQGSSSGINGTGTTADALQCSSYQHFSSFSSTGTSVFGPTAEEDPSTLDSDGQNRCSSAIAAAFQYQYKPMVNHSNTSSFENDTNQISNSNSSLCPSGNNNNNISPSSSKPPALPPKKYKQQQVPLIKHSFSEHGVCKNVELNPITGSGICSTSTSNVPRQLELHYDQSLLPAESSHSELASPTGRSSVISIPSLGPVQSISSPMPSEIMELPINAEDEPHESLYLLDVSDSLLKNDAQPQVVKGVAVEGPEVKGADPVILLVYAGSPYLDDAKFREVFLLTYRTFLPPIDAINLLWRRYQYFEKRTPDRTNALYSRATLGLFSDVITSLTPMDLEDEVVKKIRDCIYHLIMCGELSSALKARRGLIMKYEVRYKLLSPKPPPATLAVTVESNSLLQWSATSTAQQMTLLDADLFRHLEPAELLLWAREQTEDFCPALNNFTEHFNKVSYWARSRVLLCANSRERNRTMKKLIEVMRKLREFNNFNSLLAVLAALDSAPIRRLGFSKRLTEALKPHAVLTDSSGSFRTYRQALSESKPPCIPYIGLVLQDLTFVHIGNADFLPDGKVNWIKRWQQWIVLEPIRRFHDCHHGFVKNDSLLAFLNNFDDSLNDDDLWQLSEAIKPRGKN